MTFYCLLRYGNRHKTLLIIQHIIMKSKFLLFTATLFLLFNATNAQNPVFVKDNIRELRVSGDKLFIETYDGKTGRFGFWASDGTAAGTTFLMETESGVNNKIFDCNGIFFFFMQNTNYKPELWTTDGTAEGTRLVKKLTQSTTSFTRGMVVYNNKFYFKNYDEEHGTELWESDGTETGTKLAIELMPGKGHGLNDKEAVVFKGKMYFNVIMDLGNNKIDIELWVSDGTPEGTKFFKDLNPHGASYARKFNVIGDKLYFNATTKYEGTELWVSDGTEDGTFLLKDIAPTSEYDPGTPHAYNGKVYFITHGKFSPYQLWVTDGTTAGTSLLEENVGYKVVGTDDGLLFSKIISTTNDSDNYALYKTTGEPGGASLVKAIEGGSSKGYPVHFRAANGKWYFAIYDRKDDYDYSNIWETDGTAENTKLVRDDQGNLLEEDREYDLISYNNALFFVMDDENSGTSLYRLGSPSTVVTEAVRENFEVVLFPNPANNQLTIKTDEKLIGSDYTVLNITGQTVYSGKIISNNTLLEVGDLPGGSYFVRVQSKEGSKVSRFIKE